MLTAREAAIFDAALRLAARCRPAESSDLEELHARWRSRGRPELAAGLGAGEAAGAAPVSTWYFPVLEGVLAADVAGAMSQGPSALRELVDREVQRLHVPAEAADDLLAALPEVLRRMAESLRLCVGPASVASAREGRPAGLLEVRLRHPDLVSSSPRMDEVLKVLGRVAASELSVLVHGESGTGKEVLARAIHAASARADRPFVAVNCAAIPAELAESELFGHARGAYTGADRDTEGYFRQAHGGTLFLDEVGEMPLAVQVKLLRALQERQVRPLGGAAPVAVDARVLAATNRDLEAAVELGGFRRDLYYRLAELEIAIPPLRERPEDVPVLVEHLVLRHGSDPRRFSAAALAVLGAYPWPGNVRELENVIRQALVMSPAGEVRPEHLPERVRRAQRAESANGREGRYEDRLASREREVLLAALVEHGWNVSRTAEALSLSRRTLQRHLKRLGLAAEVERRRSED